MFGGSSRIPEGTGKPESDFGERLDTIKKLKSLIKKIMAINHNSSLPLISVIMPVYNRDEYLREAIESILGQTYENFELIIVDDGSTDGSASIIKEYARLDRRIHPFFFSHQGVPRISNAASALAKGTLIARQDSDDIALPDRLEKQYMWLQENNLDICGCQLAFFTGRKDEVKEKLLWQPQSHEAIIRNMLFGHPMLTGTMMMRSDICINNPFNETIDFIDTEWPMKMAIKHKMGNMPKFLLKVRRHETNITALKKDAFSKSVRKARFQFFYHLYPNTPLPDYMAFTRLADSAPMTSLWELERAGQWLVQLADYPDDKLQERMAKRWQETYERSKCLGHESEQIFSRYQKQMKSAFTRLESAC
jgi:glycosyltransferase involved in cell wall biosynthesis